MDITQKDTDILERKCAIFVLLAVKNHPNKTKTQIMNIDGNSNEKTKFLRINELLDKGLIVFDYVDGCETKRLNLSPKGKEMAELLDKAITVMAKQ